MSTKCFGMFIASTICFFTLLYVYTVEYYEYDGEKRVLVSSTHILKTIQPNLQSAAQGLCDLKIIVKRNPHDGTVHKRLIATGTQAVDGRRVFVVTPGIDGLGRDNTGKATLNPPLQQFTIRAEQYESLTITATN